ncbi:MAG: fusion protein PurCD [Thermoproteota archaeon]|nr:fusion protein PurCD [Thermoproteota archaeon]
MEKIGVLVVSYGAREVAMVDAFSRSKEYTIDLYIADRHRNPFNVERAKEHVVIPDLSVDKICRFAEKRKDKIRFGIVGPEGPIIAGVRDVVEKETKIPMVCPTREYAIESSKIAQRLLFQRVVPQANPRFKVFSPKDYSEISDLKVDLWKWLDELDNQVAVKPDGVSAGKGVGVWGDHFTDRDQLLENFLSNYKYGPVIVEEKIFGEESSFQAFCDGKNIIPLPETRDNKRAFDGDAGPNTGGMGSYKDVNNWLPFITQSEWENEVEISKKIFETLKGRGSNPGLRGIPFYLAFMHTGKGAKILENNSRPGDPEIQNLLPILKDDFAELCLRMIEGALNKVEFEPRATVVTYKVPPTYGGKMRAFKGDSKIDLSEAYKLKSVYDERIRVYPAAAELRESDTYALTSRVVSVVGIADDISGAREISLKGIDAIKGGGLWSRRDIASKEHINNSIEHMKMLRG